MTNQQIYSLLAKKYNISFNEARQVCNSGFKFIRERMNDTDPKPILLAKLFKFKLKPKYERELKNITKD